jgi:hypothetical protein
MDIASKSWKEYSEENLEDIAIIKIPKLLVNELSLIHTKENLYENSSADNVDYVNKENSRKSKHHIILQQRDNNDDENPINFISGENRVNTVIAGRIAGLIPVPLPNMRHEDEDEKNVDSAELKKLAGF